MQVSKVCTRNLKGSRTGARRHNQLVEPKLSTRLQSEPLALGIHGRNLATDLHLDSMRAIKIFGIDPDGVFGISASKKAF